MVMIITVMIMIGVLLETIAIKMTIIIINKIKKLK